MFYYIPFVCTGTHLRLNWASRRETDSSDASGTLMKDAYGNVYGPPIGTDLGANGVAGYVLPPPPGLPPNFAVCVHMFSYVCVHVCMSLSHTNAVRHVTRLMNDVRDVCTPYVPFMYDSSFAQ